MSTSKKGSNKQATVNTQAQENAVKPAFTVKQLHDAITTANGKYKQRKGATANVNKSGFNPDLAKAHKIASGLTDGQILAISELDITDKLIAGLTDASNTKKPMRTLQALLFTVTGSGNYLKGSAKTFLLEFCGLVAHGVKNRDGLRFCATGKGSEHTSDEVRNTAQARKLLKAFEAVSVASESTQNSVSFSKGGIAETLGVARKDTRTGLPVVNTDNKVAQALNNVILKLTDNSIALLVAQSGQKESSK